VTSVRLFGTSYGGVLALNMIRTDAAKQWPADRCLAISPPVSMRATADLVDQFRKVDLPKYSDDLMKLLGGYTPKSDLATSSEEGLVRAGIAYVFFNGLKNVVKESAKRYMPDLQDRLEAEESANPSKRRLSDWGKWTFDDFVDVMSAPYWKTTPDELWRSGDVGALLDGAPSFVQVVVAADDPLSRPEEIQALKQRFPEPRVLILPHGGHMGYCGTAWLKALLTKTFKP
jgi:predicted alpha/beta-fold hydrolase